MIARSQYGLITSAQLLEAGVPGPAVRRLVGSGRLSVVRRGVYRLCGAAPSWRASALAVVLSLSVDRACVLSHRSAGVLWGLLDRHKTEGPIEITAEARCRLPGVVSHRHALAQSAVTSYLGIPVTTIERTLLDLAERFDAVDLGRLMDEAMRRRLTTPAHLATATEGMSPRGRRRLRPFVEALQDRGIGYDPGANDWEKEMDRIWDELGLPAAVRQYRLCISGRTLFIDRAIVEEKIAVEWNGFSPHGERSKFDADSNRRALLIVAGWLPLDFTSRSSPRLICETVLSAYQQRRRDRAARDVG
jgi:hypothetical protein